MSLYRSLVSKAENLVQRGARATARRTFYETSQYRWSKVLEENWEAIRDESLPLLSRLGELPDIDDVSYSATDLAEDDYWKFYPLYISGRPTGVASQFPRTLSLLKDIPTLVNAGYSILRPGTVVNLHRDAYHGLLRYHLGLITPGNEGECQIEVNGQAVSWAEGESFLWDYTQLHRAWNKTDQSRVILLLDIVNPLWFPLSVINRWVIREFARSDAQRQLLEKFS